jgi:hypothetical protein
MLAAFCWTKSLLCNVATFTGMMLFPESTLQLCPSRRFCEVFKEVYFSSLSAIRTTWQYCPDAHQSATSVQTTWYFVRTLICQSIIRPDAHQCLEASNSSSLHPSRRNGKSSGRSSEFEKIPVFKCIRRDDVAISSGRHSVFDKR